MALGPNNAQPVKEKVITASSAVRALAFDWDEWGFFMRCLCWFEGVKQ
jgi:hypothetical protein